MSFEPGVAGAVNLGDMNVGPFVSSLAAQADGKILVSGLFTTLGGQSRSNLGRLNANGALDTSFNPTATNYTRLLAVQTDGKILVGGWFTPTGAQADYGFYTARLDSDGTLDRGFKPAVANREYVVAVQADGKIVVGGQFGILDGQARLYTGRLNADGSLDLSFNPGYFAMGAVPRYHRNDAYAPYVSSLAVQADGKILVAGMFAQLAGQSRWNIGRLNADGTLDTTFDPGINETYPTVSSVVVQADGKILVGGQFTKLGGQSRTNIGRVYNTGAATQSLAFDGSTVTWMRGGTGPEVWCTTFEYTFNGSSWTNLGAGTRIPGGWQLSGLALPTNSTLRARGYTAGGFLETILQPALVISDLRWFADGHIGFNVSGPFGQTVVIDGSPDLQIWAPLRTNNMVANPSLFSNSQAAVFGTRFYRLRAQI